MTNPAMSTRLCWFFSFSLICFWFFSLDYRHLMPTDEGRYAEIAREMLVSGDWITPRYNDYKYFEKPPLQMWMTALFYAWFGVGEWQARLWSALMSCAAIFMLYFTARQCYTKHTAICAAALLASTPYWIVQGHWSALDSALSSWLSIALCCFLLAQRTTITLRASKFLMWGCWASIALAVLSKGLIGIALPAVVFAVYLLCTLNWMLLTRLYFLSGISLFLLITLPWFIAVSQANPEFPHFFFVHEHWQRFTSAIHQRTEPFYFFLPVLFLGFLPWWPQLSCARLRITRQLPGAFNKELLLWIWVIVIFLFFSCSQSKLIGYIMPVFPALALLAAHAWSQQARQRQQNILRLQMGFSALCCVSIFFVEGYLPQTPEWQAYIQWIKAASGCLMIGLFCACLLLRRSVFFSFLLYTTSVAFSIMILLLGHEVFGRQRSGIDIAKKVEVLLRPEDPLYALAMLDHTLPFYLRHRLIMVMAADELTFGAQQEPQKFIATFEHFREAWQQKERAFAMMAPSMYAQLETQGLTMHKIAEDGKRVIVTKHKIH